MSHPKVCIIGLGRFGTALADALMERRCFVRAIDRQEAVVQAMADRVDEAFILDATDPRALESMRLAAFDAVCVTTGHELGPFLAVANALGPEHLNILFCRPLNDAHRFALRQLGIHHTLEVERLAAGHAARDIAPCARETEEVRDG